MKELPDPGQNEISIINVLADLILKILYTFHLLCCRGEKQKQCIYWLPEAQKLFNWGFPDKIGIKL